MQKILDLLKRSTLALAPSSEYRDGLAEIDVPAAQATVDALQAERDAVLLTGTDANLEEIESRIRSAQREVDRQRVAAAELERLAREAAQSEAASAIEARGKVAREACHRTLAAYVEIDELATRLAELLTGIEADRRVIADANTAFVAAGRADLKVPSPHAAMAEAFEVSAESLPSPLRWELKGYWPPDTAVAARRRLARAAELIPRRKAA